MHASSGPAARIPILTAAAFLVIVLPLPARAQWVSGGIPVCGAISTQEGIAMLQDGAGGVYVAWHDARTSSTDNFPRDIYVARLTGAGTLAPGWPANGLVVCNASGNQWWPKLAPDGAGGVIVFWEDDRTTANEAGAYAQRVLGTGVVAWTPNGVRLSSARLGQFVVGAVSDGTGGAIVMWQDNPGTDLYAQRVTAAGAIAPGWPLDGAPVCIAAGNQNNAHIASDHNGGAVMSWADQRTGTLHLYALRMTPNGAPAPGWTTDGIPVCTAPGNPFSNDLTGDGSGGAVVSWLDTRSGQVQIFAQRLTADGAVAPGWIPDGVLVSNALGALYPAIAPDGSGGAFIAWQDYRYGSNFGTGDIRAMRITGGGNWDPGWTPDGVAVCTAPGTQRNPAMAADGMGGVVIAWQDNRATVPTAPQLLDLSALRLTSAGTPAPGWPADGAPLCTAEGFQQLPQVAADGNGGAFVAWLDSRNPDPAGTDIYAMHVPPDAAVPVLVSNASAEAAPDRLRLRWSLESHGAELRAMVYRREEHDEWEVRAPVTPDGSGFISYEDRDVQSARRYGYRLGIREGGIESFAGEVWVDVPGPHGLSLAGLRPNPSRGEAYVEFSLASAGPAVLEMLDVAGRRVLAREVGHLGAGPHRLPLEETARLKPGVYLLRLAQGETSANARAVSRSRSRTRR
jgi:hypothetical protein